MEGAVAVGCVGGNLLIIAAFLAERRLRTVTNAYIASLALTDLLVGAVGIPLTLYTLLTNVLPLSSCPHCESDRWPC